MSARQIKGGCVDFLKELGVLAFGSRLKRLLERLNKDIFRFYQLQAVDFQPHWFSTLYLLGLRSPMKITGIAEKLCYTHPAVNKLVAQMNRAGLVRSSQGKKDRRQRLVYLTGKGRALIGFLSPVWEEISSVMSELIADSGQDFMGAINGLEDTLDRRGMYSRLVERAKSRLLDQIVILNYRPAFKKHFKDLNYQWLQESFKVEKLDEEFLSDPYGKIIKEGGAVLFARLRGKIVGTCALIKHDNGLWEMAKLAVAEGARERYVGTKLISVIIEKATSLGASTLHLETSPSDPQAIVFFGKFGFKRIKGNPLPARYGRPRLTMELRLSDRT
jgi:DNA-binding MarR family transcriptional regulator